MNSDPFIDRNGTLDSVATALAKSVLPQPGGPKSKAPRNKLCELQKKVLTKSYKHFNCKNLVPFGTLAPSFVYLSGFLR